MLKGVSSIKSHATPLQAFEEGLVRWLKQQADQSTISNFLLLPPISLQPPVPLERGPIPSEAYPVRDHRKYLPLIFSVTTRDTFLIEKPEFILYCDWWTIVRGIWQSLSGKLLNDTKNEYFLLAEPHEITVYRIEKK